MSTPEMLEIQEMSEMKEESLSDVKSDITSKGSMEDPDSGDEVPDSNPGEVMEVRCGLLTGKLHLQRFTCPGIHKRCIEYEGKLISPRQFTIKAEKDKQKDWKGSIRLGRQNLRTMMELHQLDFYDHETNCSLKCQSRNYIKNRKSETESLSLLDPTAFLSLSDGNQPSSSNGFSDDARNGHRKLSSALEDYASQTVHKLNGHSMPNVNGDSRTDGIFGMNGVSQQRRTSDISHNGSVASQLSLPLNPTIDVLSAWNHGIGANGPLMPSGMSLPQQPLPELGAEAFSLLLQSLMDQQKIFAHGNQNGLLSSLACLSALKPPTNLLPTTAESQPHDNGSLNGFVNGQNDDGSFSAANIRKIMETSPLVFWSRMRDLGILDELLNTLSVTVEQIKGLYVNGTNGTEEFAAQRLSALANMLDLGDVFAQRIHSRYIETTQESNLISKELQELQQKAEEQKKRLETAKRKSQVFDQMIKPSEPIDFKKVKLPMS